VQILSYYGEIDGAPVSAFYRLRYAEVLKGSTSPTVELSNVDGSAGGPTGSADSPSGCLDLASGEQTKLSPTEAAASSDWHLCFRRETIAVNGELGGPRGAVAVDLDSAKTPLETTIASVADRTAESELDHFNAITYEMLTDPGLAYRGDRVASIFAGQWVDAGGPSPAPLPATWVVVHAADGEARSLITFPRFEGAGDASPGNVIIQVKPVLNQ